MFNAHGDVVHLTDSAGAVTKRYHYDAFGNEVSPSAGDGNPWRYCGEYFDGETGTVYLRARYYDPRTGRFGTEDSVRARRMNIFDRYNDYQSTLLNGGVFKDEEKFQYIVDDPLSLNLYLYCHSNPVRYTDPTGESIQENFIKGMKYMTEVFENYPEFLKNTDKILTDFGNRIPDFTNAAKTIIGEIKNTPYQTLTAQLKGFLQVVKDSNGVLQFILVVKEGTRLSKPLLRWIAEVGGIVEKTKFGFQPFFMFDFQMDMIEDLMKEWQLPASERSRL